MLLFGKASFTAAPQAFARSLLQRVSACPAPGLAEAREWLVFTGQLEQAVLDQRGPQGVAAITDVAAELFLDLRSGKPPANARRALMARLAGAALPCRTCEFRIPEGFAWYALHPDSYAEAAERWATANPGQSVVTIGLRSIGTSLSAVVAEALRRHGAAVEARVTVRPRGHPFRRTVVLPGKLPDAGAFLIVDEGPGLSGSSFTGTAAALAARGIPADAIHFFPGHDNGPGKEAGKESRTWWRCERCWSSPQPAFGPLEQAGGVPHFGGFAAVNGNCEALWRRSAARQTRLAKEGLAMALLSAADGWLMIADDGEALTGADLDADFIVTRLAALIARAALPEDPAGEDASLWRIAEALTYLEEAGFKATLIADFRERAARGTYGSRRAGSGRLGPTDWTRLADGRVLKREAIGADCDHGWAGSQSILWDVAGAMTEWDMDGEQSELLMNTLHARHGLRFNLFALAFHQAGYCALELARAVHGDRPLRAEAFRRRLRLACDRLKVTA